MSVFAPTFATIEHKRSKTTDVFLSMPNMIFIGDILDTVVKVERHVVKLSVLVNVYEYKYH